MLVAAFAMTLFAVAFASAQTAEQEDARKNDVMRYANLSDAQAWSLARRVLPEDPDALPLGERLAVSTKARASQSGQAGKAARTGAVEYLSDHTAVVKSTDAKAPSTFVSSAAPLRAKDTNGQLRPVDLRLKPRGRSYLAPENAGTDVLLSRTLGRSSLLRDAGLTVRPLMPASGRVTARQAATAFFANAGTSTDVTLSAEAGGLQAMWVLRSPASPQRVRLALGSKAGLKVTPRKHGAFLLRNGKRRTVARVLPPVAWDADGKAIAVRASHRGSTLVYDVAHRERSVRYPIVLDPSIITESYNGTTSADFSGWTAGPGPATGHTTALTGSRGNGLYLNYSGTSTTPTGKHEWRYVAPGTSILTRFAASAVTLAPTPTTTATCARIGIRTQSGAALPNAASGSCPAVVAPATTANWGATTVSTPIADTSRSNHAYFQHEQPLGLTAGTLFMQSPTVDLTDTDLPKVDSVTQNVPATTWMKGQTAWIKPTISDTGLGARSSTLNKASGTELAADALTCTGLRASRCPATWTTPPGYYTPTLNFNTNQLSEGVNTLTINTADVVGNPGTGTATVRVDRGVPDVTFGNELFDWPFLKDTAKTIDVRATDKYTGTTDPAQQRSGVQRINVQLGTANGTPPRMTFTNQGTDTTLASCAHSCALNRSFALNPVTSNLAHGGYVLRANVTDFAGNTETRDTEVFVDKRGPKLSLTGTLKDAAGSPLTKESYRLHIEANDGVPGGLERESGVDNVEILYDAGAGRQRLDYLHKACETDSCSQSHDFTFEPRRYAAGTLIVRSVDDMGNASESSLALTPGSSAFDTTSLSGLEEYLQFDSADTGAGSRAHVNQTTGNLVWNHVPLVNPGRGLTTVVNVAYNSQTRKADATFTPYRELGEGFSLGISGLTRVNEPLDLSRDTTYGEITMVDPDGTRHLFRKNGTYYEPPAGVNLHLRKYSSTDWMRAWAITRPDGVTHFFDRRGYQTFIQDRNENVLRFQYEIVPLKPAVSCPVWGMADASFAATDCRQRLIGVTDSAGVLENAPDRSMRLTYTSADGPVSSVTDHGGRILGFTYSGGRLSAMSQADGTPDERTFKFLYGGYGLATIQDPRGAETRVTYTPGYIAKLAGVSPAPDTLSDARVTSLRQRDMKHRDYVYAKAPTGATAQYETRASDARSETTVYQTDHRGRTLQLTDPRGTVSKLRWDGDNNVTQVAEAAGTTDEAVTQMAYNENGQLLWTSDPVDNRTELTYQVGEGVHVAEGGEGRVDFVSDLNRIEHPKGVATGAADDFTELFEVDARGNVTGRRDQEGNWAHTEFDRFGRVVLETDEVGNETRYEQYDHSGNPRVVIDPKQGRSEFSYDAIGNLLATTDPRAAEHGGLRDPEHRFQARFRYDAQDQLVEEILPKDSERQQFITRRYDYDVNGNALRSVDGVGAATTQTFDEMDRPTTSRSASTAHAGETAQAPEVTRRTFDGEGNVLREQSPRGEENQASDQDFSTDYEYDPNSQVIVIRRHQLKDGVKTSLVSSMGYDRRGNLTGVVDPKENAEASRDTPLQNVAENDVRFEYRYDKADRRVKQIEDPQNLYLETTTEYDRNDNVVKVTNPRWNSTRSQYDQRDLLVAQVDTLGRRQALERRADGKVESILSPRKFEHWTEDSEFRERLVYDGLGDIVERQLPRWRDGADPTTPYAWRWQRDQVGNPLVVTDPRGKQISNDFLDSGDLRSTTRPGAWETDGDKLSEKDWRSMGNRGEKPNLPSSEGEGDFGAVKPEKAPGLLPAAGRVSFGYDDEMRLASVTEEAGGATVQLTRDRLGRVTKLRRPLDASAGRFIEQTAAYDRNGNLTVATDGKGNAIRTTFDQFDRPVELAAPGSSDTGKDTTKLTYDANGKVTDIVSARGTTSRRCYDRIDRLVESIDPLGNTTSKRYDEVGNVIRERSPKGTGTWAAGAACPSAVGSIASLQPHVTTRTYDEVNQLKTVQVGTSTEKTTTFGYDFDGNQTSIDAPGAKAPGAATADRRITQRVFDARGNQYREITGVGANAVSKRRVRVTEFDAMGNLRRTVNPKGIGAGDKPVKPDAPAPQTSIDSEADRTDTKVREAAEHATVYEYSDDNLLTGIRLPNGGQGDGQWRQTFHLDSRGRVDRIDAPHEWTRNPRVCTFDSVDPAFEKQTAGEPNCIQRTKFTHFDTGWIKTSESPQGRHPERGAIGGDVHTYDYDERGLQEQWQVANKDGDVRRTMVREYWPSGLLKTRKADRPGEDDSDRRRAYEYRFSPNRKLISVIDKGKDLGDPTDNRAYRMAYDKAERIIATDEDDFGGRTGTDTFVDYDANGNLKTRKADGKLDATVDDRGELSGTGYTGGTTSTFAFDEFDRESETRIDRPKDTKIQIFKTDYYGSDDRQQRIEQTATRPSGTPTPRVTESYFWGNDGFAAKTERRRNGVATPVKDQTYKFDLNGNRTEDETGSDYQYNARDQLTQWTRRNSGPKVDYKVNGAGDVLQKTDNAGTPKVTDNRYAAGRLIESTIKANSSTSWTKVRYGYDTAAANVQSISEAPVTATGGTETEGTRKQVAEFKYDVFDRLKEQSAMRSDTDKDVEVFELDGFDRRDTVKESFFRPGAATEERAAVGFSYIGTSGALSKRGALKRSADKTSSFDYDSSLEVLGMSRISASTSTAPNPNADPYRSFAKDANGSVEGLTDDVSGDYTHRYRYDPYGNGVDANQNEQSNLEDTFGADAKDNPIRFQGFYHDSGVKTYDMRARSYLPSAGRFLTEDRFESSSGDFNLVSDPLTQSRYAFAGGNPISNVEFDGHEPSSSYTNGCDSTYGSARRCRGAARKRTQRSHARAQRTAADSGVQLSRPRHLDSPAAQRQSRRASVVQQAEINDEANQARNNGGGGGGGGNNTAKQAGYATGAGGALAQGAAKRNKVQENDRDHRRANRRMAARDPKYRAGRKALQRFGPLAGPAGIAVSGGLDYAANRAEGDSRGRAFRKAAVNTGFQALGTWGGTAACGAVATTGVGAAACPFLVAGGNLLGTAGGELANAGIDYVDENWDEVEAGFEQGVEDVGNTIEGGAEALDDGVDALGEELGIG